MPKRAESAGAVPSRPSSLSNPKALAFALALLRVVVGLKFLQAGLEKWSWLGTNRLGALLTHWALGEPPAAFPSYVGFLTRFVLPHIPLFTALVVFGEILVGAFLILGLLTRLAILPALAMSINYLLATWNLGSSYQGFNEVVIAIELCILLAGAGRYAGIDARLARERAQWPFW